MATKLTTGIPVNVFVTSPGIREAAQWVEDLLVTTGGWVQVAQTGETAPSALPACPGANSKCGFRCYRMADALQATAPIFLRIDYGSSSGSGSATGFAFGMWITIGMGVNGSGGITTPLYNGGASATPQIGSNVGGNTCAGSTGTCYGSADPSRVQLSMYNNGTWGFGLPYIMQSLLSIERTKDALGNDTGEGILLTYSDVNNQGGGGSRMSLNTARYLAYTAGVQPPSEVGGSGGGLSYAMGKPATTENFGTNDIGVGMIMHFKGIAQQPGVGLVIINYNDVGPDGSFQMNVYGVTHTYQSFQNITPVCGIISGTWTADGNRRAAMRFD